MNVEIEVIAVRVLLAKVYVDSIIEGRDDVRHSLFWAVVEMVIDSFLGVSVKPIALEHIEGLEDLQDEQVCFDLGTEH